MGNVGLGKWKKFFLFFLRNDVNTKPKTFRNLWKKHNTSVELNILEVPTSVLWTDMITQENAKVYPTWSVLYISRKESECWDAQNTHPHTVTTTLMLCGLVEECMLNDWKIVSSNLGQIIPNLQKNKK